MFYKGYLLLATFLLINCTKKGVLCQDSVCPDPTELSPYCHCFRSAQGEINLDCSAVKNELELEWVFTNVSLSSPNISLLTIRANNDLKYLTRNVFGNVTFERIYFASTVLEYIDESVFVDSYLSLSELSIDVAKLAPQGFPFSSLDQYKSLITLRLTQAGTFDVIPKLVSNSIQELTFYGNIIKYLQDQVFDGMPKLESLDLSMNSLTSQSLPSGIFYHNPVLKTVRLDDNEISVIETGAFRDLPMLESIDILRNKITEIKEGAFYNLPRLEYLTLKSNELSNLMYGSLALLPSLSTFNVWDNSIQFIDPEFFSNFSSLYYVDIDSNNLTSILPGTFDVMESALLYVNFNKMTTLEENWLQRVLINNNAVHIEGNPLDCGCDMAWLFADVSLLTNLYAQCDNGTDIHNLDPLYFINNC